MRDVKIIDARGPRFGAFITAPILATILVTGWVPLLLWQTAVFLIGATMGPSKSPYAYIYRKFIRPRLNGADDSSTGPTEDSRPPQFAQGVGALFSIVALVGVSLGVNFIVSVAIGFALAAALLQGVFSYCLGCQLYLLLVRATTRSRKISSVDAPYALPSL